MTLYTDRHILTKRQLREEALRNPRGVRVEGSWRGKLVSFTLDQLASEERVEVRLPRGTRASITRTPAGLLVR